jgi:protein TonB
MLAYAAHRRSQRRLSPSALAMIAAGHAIAIGLLITAKMDVGIFTPPGKTKIYDVPLPPPPDQPKPEPKAQEDPRLPPPPDSRIDNPPPLLPALPSTQTFDPGPAINSVVPDIGPALGATLPSHNLLPPISPPAVIVRIAARPVTPADLLRPPYPESKQRTEEEAVLRLRLSIDARGRVTGVEPIGAVDPAFFTAARSHLTRYWRYRPASEDGRAVDSTLTITLRFELED